MNRLVVFVFCACAATLAAQPAVPAFEVASIKRNTDPNPRNIGTARDTPKGEIQR